MEVSIPALDSTVLIHVAIVALDARPCGSVNDKKTAASPAESKPLILCVLSTYSCNVKVGHMFWFSGNAGRSILLWASQVGTVWVGLMVLSLHRPMKPERGVREACKFC